MTITPWPCLILLCIAVICIGLSNLLKSGRIDRLEQRIQALERSVKF